MVNCKHQESGWEGGGKPLGRLVCDPEQEAIELWLEVGPGMDSQPHGALTGHGVRRGQSAPRRLLSEVPRRQLFSSVSRKGCGNLSSGEHFASAASALPCECTG